jgi:hypothetical protein
MNRKIMPRCQSLIWHIYANLLMKNILLNEEKIQRLIMTEIFLHFEEIINESEQIVYEFFSKRNKNDTGSFLRGIVFLKILLFSGVLGEN